MILPVPPDAPFVLRAAADTILFLHIAGGSVGILSGSVALVARKGERLHRISGTVFFVSMLIMSGIGFLVSPFLPSATNTIAGLLTFYLVATAWLTVRRKDGRIGPLEKAAIAIPVIACAAGVAFIILAWNSPTGTIEDTPPQAFVVFLLLGAIAAGSDLKVILHGGISGAPRIARHLWRMCTALTVASGSFFLGQQPIMPVFMRGSLWLFVPVFAPVVLLFFWLVRVRFTHWIDGDASRVPGPPFERLRTVKKVLTLLLWGVLGAVALVAALFFYFIYSPLPEIPHLSGALTRHSIVAGGLTRTWRTYVPKGLARGAPLVLVMHGSGENGRQVRLETGYAFDRLADAHRFAVVYPDGYEGYWNACNRVGDYAANRLNIDDVKFLTTVVNKTAREIGIDQARVYAAGVSRGGHMAFRLALEAPERFRAVAAVSAGVPTPDNFKCRPAAGGTASLLIINGTRDPLNPFEGGEVRLLGFIARGTVLSSRASAQYFADRNRLGGPRETREIFVADGIRVARTVWHNDSRAEVELDAIEGGGHGMPQPYYRNPRLLGPTAKEPNGPDVIWKFFARQR